MYSMCYYEVRFNCYQYNCGGQIRNGIVNCKRQFKDLDKAKEYLGNLKENLRLKGYSQWWTDESIYHIHDGYVDKIDGIYLITEEKLNV